MSGGGGSRNVPTEQTVTQRLSPEQEELLGLALPAARDYARNPPTLFPGSQIAPQHQLQQEAQQLTLQAARPGGQLSNFVGGTLGYAGNLLGGGQAAPTAARPGWVAPLRAADPLPGQQVERFNQPNQRYLNYVTDPGYLANIGSDPAVRGAAEAAIRPITEQFTQQALPGIRSQAIQAGQFGGSRQDLATRGAARDYLRGAGDITSQIYNQALRDRLAAAGQAFGAQTGAAASGFGARQAALTGQRGQDIGAQVSYRGQDLGARGQDVTQRGQDIQREIALRGQDVGARTAALQQAPQLAGLAGLPARQIGAVGGQLRGEEQALLNEAVQRHFAQQTLPFAAAQDVAALASGLPGGSVHSQGTTAIATPGINPFQALSGVGSLFAGGFPGAK